jgi:hypothetical protein
MGMTSTKCPHGDDTWDALEEPRHGESIKSSSSHCVRCDDDDDDETRSDRQKLVVGLRNSLFDPCWCCRSWDSFSDSYAVDRCKGDKEFEGDGHVVVVETSWSRSRFACSSSVAFRSPLLDGYCEPLQHEVTTAFNSPQAAAMELQLLPLMLSSKETFRTCAGKAVDCCKKRPTVVSRWDARTNRDSLGMMMLMFSLWILRCGREQCNSDFVSCQIW